MPDQEIKDGDVIKGNGWTFEAIHTPGHMSNHICFALREENAIFSGDHVMGWSTSVISAGRQYGGLHEFAQQDAHAGRRDLLADPWAGDHRSQDAVEASSPIVTAAKMPSWNASARPQHDPGMVEVMEADVDPRCIGQPAARPLRTCGYGGDGSRDNPLR